MDGCTFDGLHAPCDTLLIGNREMESLVDTCGLSAGEQHASGEGEWSNGFEVERALD